MKWNHTSCTPGPWTSLLDVVLNYSPETVRQSSALRWDPATEQVVTVNYCCGVIRVRRQLTTRLLVDCKTAANQRGAYAGTRTLHARPWSRAVCRGPVLGSWGWPVGFSVGPDHTHQLLRLRMSRGGAQKVNGFVTHHTALYLTV